MIEIHRAASMDLGSTRHIGVPEAAQGSLDTGVSLEIPGIIVSLEIPGFRIFLLQKSGKIAKIYFRTPGTKVEF